VLASVINQCPPLYFHLITPDKAGGGVERVYGTDLLYGLSSLSRTFIRPTIKATTHCLLLLLLALECLINPCHLSFPLKAFRDNSPNAMPTRDKFR
jgi:hypothetical protein